METFIPLQDYAVVELKEEEAVSGTLHLPVPLSDFLEGTVVSVGPGTHSPLGHFVPTYDTIADYVPVVELGVKKGDRVVFGRNAGVPLRIQGDTRKLLLVRATQFVGRVEGVPDAVVAHD